MASIVSSVGRSGRNRDGDVKTVQNLLNKHIRVLAPIRPLVADSECGSKTIQAIRAFQLKVVRMGNPDGRVDPGGNTLAALNQPVSENASQNWHYPAGPQEGLIDIARPYVGARESRNNRMGDDPRMREIFEADRLQEDGETDGYPWCCAFVSMCVQKFIAQNRSFYGHVSPPHTAGVLSFRTRWAVRENCIVFPPNDPTFSPHRGDVVVYTFSHIGIVDAVQERSVTTIEGNTNEAGSREGTSVLNKNRDFKRIRCFIRMPLPISYDVSRNMCVAPEPAANMSHAMPQ